MFYVRFKVCRRVRRPTCLSIRDLRDGNTQFPVCFWFWSGGLTLTLQSAEPMEDLPSHSINPHRNFRHISVSDAQEIQGSTACHHFSIRGYVSELRKIQRKACWPFDDIDGHNQLEKLPNILPPMALPSFKWWGCESCISEIKMTESSENTDVSDLAVHDPSHIIKPDPVESAVEATNGIKSNDDTHFLIPNPSQKENEDPVHDLENADLLEGKMQDSVARTDQGKSMNSEQLVLDFSAGDDRKSSKEDSIVQTDGTSVEISDVNQIDECLCYSGKRRHSKYGRPRKKFKIRTLADIMKSEELTVPSKEEFTRANGSVDIPEERTLTDEQLLTADRNLEARNSYGKLLKNRKKSNLQSLRKRPRQAEESSNSTIDQIKDISSADTTEQDRSRSVSEGQKFKSSECPEKPSENSVCVPKDSSLCKDLNSSPNTECKAAAAPVYEKQAIVDDIPVEILQLLQSNFHKNHKHEQTRPSVCQDDRIGQSKQEKIQVRLSKFGHENDSSTQGRPAFIPRRRKVENKKKDGSSANHRNSCSYIPNLHFYHEALSAMRLLRLMDPAVALDDTQTGTARNLTWKQGGSNNQREEEVLDGSSLTQNTECFDRARSSGQSDRKKRSASRLDFPHTKSKKRRIKNSKKFDLGSCTLNRNPAEFSTLDERDLFMISYNELKPRNSRTRRKKKSTAVQDFPATENSHKL
ncbi:embryonic flower 1 (EMF1) isoform X2 [Wolffia australiana]